MINRVVLVGRLTRDPDSRGAGSGTSVVTFTVAIDNRGKDAEGKKTTSFIPCVVFGDRGDTVIKYARKGMLVGVEGRLNQRSYLKTDGSKASVIEVICDSVQFLERRDQAVENEEMEIPPFDDVTPSNDEDSKNLDSINMTDDDLPF